MREILFRGMPIDDTEAEIGKWKYGFYKEALGHHRIMVHNNRTGWTAYAVEPESVGQYTGIVDATGDKIFEGDIVYVSKSQERPEYSKYDSIFEVYFDTEMLEYGLKYSHELFHCQFSGDFELIGNVTENLELFGKL